MTEKRFTKDYVNGLIYITDNFFNKGYCIICEGRGGDIDNIVDKLNEQQVIIEQLKKDKAILNERLRECGMRVDKLLGNCR